MPAFKPPKSRNAATTLLLLGGIAVTMLVGIVALARLTGLQFVENPAAQIVSGPAGYEQKTVTAQLAETVFGAGSVMLYVVAGATALILFLAANTAFNGFPGARLDPRPGPLPAPPAAHPRRPARVLQRHRLPRRLRDRADRRRSRPRSPG